MKLNPKKCTFGMQEGMFLGYKVSTNGLKACPNKADAVLSLLSPRCIKDVQKLNGKLASLNRFLSKLAEKSLPFFKTLKNCTKKRFSMDTRSRRGLQANEKTYCRTPNTYRPKGTRGVNHILACSKRSYQRGLDNGQRRQANTNIFCKPHSPRPGSQLYPYGKVSSSLAQCKQTIEKIFPGTHGRGNNKSTDKATVVKFGNIRKDAEVEVRVRRI
ncbi:hypothetical protein Tco_0178036 [Tanacetum coccineum]